MTTATVGTGTITLGAAVSGYLSFAGAGAANGDIVSYGISDGTNSEVGTGTYTTSGTTLTRTVTKSTNSNTAISLSGTAQVFITARAEDIFNTANPLGAAQVAAKSDQQTGTSATLAVTPLHQQDHDSGAKAWVNFTGSATNGAQTINASYGVASVSRTALGQYTVVFTTLFASANYVGIGINNGTTADGGVEIASLSTGSANIVFPKFFTATPSLLDPVNGAYLVFYGRQ